MTNKSVQMTRRSRLAVVVSFALAVAAAACGDGASTMTSPSGVSPSSLAANSQSTRDFSPAANVSSSGVNLLSVAPGQSATNFSVTVTPSVAVGEATLQVTVTRDVTSGQG